MGNCGSSNGFLRRWQKLVPNRAAVLYGMGALPCRKLAKFMNDNSIELFGISTLTMHYLVCKI
jgi:hypothetical protein